MLGVADLYLDVFLLFQLEDVHVELLLEFLVCIINTKLFKGIDLKGLKAIDIQDTDELVNFLVGLQSLVNLEDYPVKQV